MSETRYYRVSGTVQGVGFRAATCQRARELDLAGWVRNRADGDVELMARGPSETLDRFADWLGRGPTAARVANVTRDDSQASDETLPRPFDVA